MGVEIRPVGVQCNLACTYCYEGPLREFRAATKQRIDLRTLLPQLDALGQPFTLFGGEPLLADKELLATLWRFGLERYGTNSVQTNGTLVDDEHIAMFRRYNVRVGFSIDGPGELNSPRAARNPERTPEATARSLLALRRVLKAGVPASLIITLHRENCGAPQRRSRLLCWLREMHGLGLQSIRFHVLQVHEERLRKALSLSTQELCDSLLWFAGKLATWRPELRVDLFDDVRMLLQGDDRQVACIWRGCDPWCTAAVTVLRPEGGTTNCGRTNEDGIAWQKAPTPAFEREMALYQTPFRYGGCKGCRFWLMCRGNCPGTAIRADARNRSEYCPVWRCLFEHYENVLTRQGITALSKSTERVAVERRLLPALHNGWHPGLYESRPQATSNEREWHVPIVDDSESTRQANDQGGTRCVS